MAVNFRGTVSNLIIVGALLVGGLILWCCLKCCRYRCCKSESMTQKQAQRQALIGLASMAMAQQQHGPKFKSGAIEGPKTESQPGSKKTKAPMKQRGTLPAVPLLRNQMEMQYVTK